MLTVDRRQFSRAIELASTVTERRTTIPALAGLKLTANGMLAVEGTDLDNYTRVEIPCQGGDAEMLLCDPGAVRRAIDAAGGSDVTLAPDKKTVVIKAGGLSIDVTTLPPDEFPLLAFDMEQVFSCSLSAADLAKIGRVTRAISTEETRYHLNGVNVRKLDDGNFRFVATDGHRLMMVDLPLADVSGELPDSFILHRRFVNIVLAQFHVTERMSLTVQSNGRTHRASLAGDVDGLRFELKTKAIDGHYPDYERVIPVESKHAIRCERSALAQAINSVQPLSSERMRAIVLRCEKGRVVLRLKGQGGSASFDLGAEHDIETGYEIGFNPSNLLDAINAAGGDKVELRLNDPGAPAIVADPSDASFLAVQMPMRVQ